MFFLELGDIFKTATLLNKLSSFVGVFKTFGKSLEKMFFKIGVFINFANFTGKQLCRNLFSRPADLLKRYSKTGVFV